MKKILLFLALLGGYMAAHAEESNDAVTVKVTSNTNLDVTLTNSTSYVAFQMDITLPKGVSFSDEDIHITTRTTFDSKATINTVEYDESFNIVSNCVDETTNKYRILGYSLGNHVIDGNSGDAIFFLSLTNENTELTEENITISNVLFVTVTDLAEVTIGASVEVDGTSIYDVNRDEKVNADDLDNLQKYCLTLPEQNSQTKETKYDINRDGKADILDIDMWVKYVLSLPE